MQDSMHGGPSSPAFIYAAPFPSPLATSTSPRAAPRESGIDSCSPTQICMAGLQRHSGGSVAVPASAAAMELQFLDPLVSRLHAQLDSHNNSQVSMTTAGAASPLAQLQASESIGTGTALELVLSDPPSAPASPLPPHAPSTPSPAMNLPPPPLPLNPPASLLQLPDDLLSVILKMVWERKDRRGQLKRALYRTCRATRSLMHPRIGSASVKLRPDWDTDVTMALGQGGALAQLRRFPRYSTLRRLLINMEAVSEHCLVNFLTCHAVGDRLAAMLSGVLQLRICCWEEEEDDQHALSVGTFCGIALACPLLTRLEICCPVASLGSLLPLHRLTNLCELALHSTFRDGDDPTVPADPAALARLVSLTKLTVGTDELGTFLPGLTATTSSFSRLADLTIISRYSDDALQSEFPEFSTLRSLQLLTHLRWSTSVRHEESWIEDSTLLAICCCSQLVSLSLPNHKEVTPHTLLNMPRLKRLAIGSLELSEPLVLDRGCGLESLEVFVVERYEQLSRMLPLCRTLTQLHIRYPGFTDWELIARDMAIVADDVGAAAEVMSRVSDGHLGRMRLSWEVPPCQPSSAIIAKLSPLKGQLQRLCLEEWVVDDALAVLLAETLPGLERLCLKECELLSFGGGAGQRGLAGMSRLCRLSLGSAIMEHEVLLSFAEAVQGRRVLVKIDPQFVGLDDIDVLRLGIAARRGEEGREGRVVLMPVAEGWDSENWHRL